MSYFVQSLTMITCITINALAITSTIASPSQNISIFPQEVQILEGPQFGFNAPTGVAVDAKENVWIVSDQHNTLTKIPADYPKGAPIVYQDSRFGFSNPIYTTVDTTGENIWVANFTNNSVTKIPTDYPKTSPTIYRGNDFRFANPFSIAIDPKGNAWVTNFSTVSWDQQYVTIIPADYPKSKPIIYKGFKNFGFDMVYAVAVDAKGNAWITSGYNKSVIKIPTDYPKTKPIRYPYTDPYPQAITIDPKGNVWVANTFPSLNDGDSVLKIPADHPNHPIVYRDKKKYGFNFPGAITADAKGNIWVVSRYAVTKIPADHPDHPIVYENFLDSSGIAVDPKGNAWIANPGENSVTKITANPNTP